MPTMTQDQIFEKVSSTLVDALGVEGDDVAKESKIKDDLGAESIDFLDISFRLEKNFGISIPKGELFPDPKLFNDATLVKDGKLTEAGLDELRKRMPFADVNEFAKNPRVDRIFDLYTVDAIVRYVEGKLKS